MTNEQAIEILRDTPIDIRSTREDDIHTLYATAQNMAIEALSAHLVNDSQGFSQGDYISRQDAIDALAKFVPYAICDESTESYTNGLTDAYNLICQLPSAQPEIIRCKDCENWDTSWKNDWAKNYHYCPLIDNIRNGDWYCADAERRTDETD